MAKEDILLRSVSNPPLTTTGAEFTLAQMDGNFIELYNALVSLSQSSNIPAYDAAVNYYLDDAVQEGTQLYKCIVAGPVTAITPSTDPAKWTPIYATDLVTLPVLNGYKKFTKTLSQAEARTLESSNASAGIELLAAPGTNNVYEIINPTIVYKALSTSVTVTGDLWIYDLGKAASRYLQTLPAQSPGTDTSYFYQLPQNDALTLANTGNAALYIYATADSPAYLGTIDVEFFYKIKDIS